MFEVPVTDKYHCNACGVAGVDRSLVLNGAARLDYCRYARFYALFNAIGEGEERIGRHDRTLCLFSRMGDSLLGCPDAVCLSHAYTRGSALFAYYYGIGLGVFYHPPREHQSFNFVLRGSAVGDYARAVNRPRLARREYLFFDISLC